MGVTTEWFLNEKNVVRYNVYDDLFPEESLDCARSRVFQRMLWHMEVDGLPKFLFLGRASAHAGPLLVRNLPWCVEKEDAMVIPHPSGRNRWYNSLANTHLTRQSLSRFLGRS